MSERDPRVDPRPGDVLRKKYQGQYFESRAYIGRTVFDVDTDEYGLTTVSYSGDNCCTPSVKLSAWRKWAKGAEVITRAEEST